MSGSDTNPATPSIAAEGADLLRDLLARPLRKLTGPVPTTLARGWEDALAAQHTDILRLIARIEATSDSDTARRVIHLAQLRTVLRDHAAEEERTVYAAMRERGLRGPAQMFSEEHAEIRCLLRDLTHATKSDPRWLDKVRALRTLLEEHMAEEEDELFPRLHAALRADATVSFGEAPSFAAA